MQRDVSQRQMLHQILEWIALMKEAVSSLLPTALIRYQCNTDNIVRWEPTLKIVGYLFVYHSRLPTNSSDPADEMASRQ